MKTATRQITGLISASLLAGFLISPCWADGGAVRAIERDGPYQISVFTSPTPLVAGPVDVSVLVQDAETLAALPETPVWISLTPRDRTGAAVTLAATSAAARNKLLRACLVELASGWYDVRVRFGREKVGNVHFALEVGPPPPLLSALWPWFTWPIVPVVLFALHELLVQKKLGKRAANA